MCEVHHGCRWFVLFPWFGFNTGMDSWHKPSHLGRRLLLRSHILGRHRSQGSRRQGRSYTPGNRTLGTPGHTRTCRVPHGRAVQGAGVGVGAGVGAG